ncbi:SRPBCC domain-containing protein [Microvirga massiliensis]|uniref:SRPBCC domain-containing protein n=1 Tax=Microvirga massiliensis TaxID=1033741 RepID=UPI00062BDBAA|nr:SRPBCC domain-containing protein [Microvirga massiliensis]
MAKTIETSITIAAPPARVWDVLTDFARFPEWNPFVRSIKGDLAAGSRLDVQIAPPGKKGMRFRPMVRAANANQELRWLGSLLVPGLFDGEHYFVLEPQGNGTTRFVHGERFSGILVGLIMSTGMLDATRQGFEAMNAALKQRAEAQT